MVFRGTRPLLRSGWSALLLLVIALVVSATAPLGSLRANAVPQKFVSDVLENGVVIVISTGSQTMHVFRDGVLWRSSPVSTGKKGKETPAGLFAILQKKTFHRSNLYANAPMPYMQRLTWSGIAIHAGALPGYPASHGCIRLPEAFAKELYELTDFTTTAVIVVKEPLAGDAEALEVAKATKAAIPINPERLMRAEPERTPAARSIPTRKAANGQTIQLAATLSPTLAQAQWEALSARRPELKAMQMAVIPAVVGGKQYYRLRATAPDAHATCKALKRAGIECFPVS